MWKIPLGFPIFSGLTGGLLPLMVLTSGAAAEDASTPSTIRAGSEIALDSCSGCHVVSPRQQFRPVGGEEIPSFEAIANGPDATANALLKNFNDTHRKKDAPQATSIFATTYISDLETSQVIAYLLTQRHQP